MGKEKATVDIIYSRVSKENETLQDLKIQENKLIEKFKLDNPKIIRSKLEELIDYIFGKDTVIEYFFLSAYKKKSKLRLFIWDSLEFAKDIQGDFFFFILCLAEGVEVYTYQSGRIKEEGEQTPSKKLTMVLKWLNSYKGKEEEKH